MDIFDFYGSTYKPQVLGKTSYKTWFSFVSSLATVILIGFAAYLIGRDFFYKLNPKVINATIRPEVTEPFYANNTEFTVAFGVESDSPLPEEERKYFYPVVAYVTFNKTEAELGNAPYSSKYYNPVPCSQTEARNNPQMSKFDLDSILCIDYEKIKKDQNLDKLALYGDWDEDYFSLFSVEYWNCKLNEETQEPFDCYSYEDAIKYQHVLQYVVLYSFSTNSNPQDYDNPLDVGYQKNFYKLSPFTSFYGVLRYSLFKFEDDRGWLFEDIATTKSPMLSSFEKEYRFLGEEAFDSIARMYVAEMNFQRAQFIEKRVYLKIQELGANLGGIIKLIMLIFSFFINLWHDYRIKSILISKNLQEKGDKGNQNSSMNALKREETLFKLSFAEYLMICLKFDKKLKGKSIEITKMENKLDIAYLLEISNKIEKCESNLQQNRENIIQLNR